VSLKRNAQKMQREGSPVVRVDRSADGYEVVLEDGDELVLAHYDTTDWDIWIDLAEARQHARADAERYAAEVRRLLRAS
jgi:hypothetical protein